MRIMKNQLIGGTATRPTADISPCEAIIIFEVEVTFTANAETMPADGTEVRRMLKQWGHPDALPEVPHSRLVGVELTKNTPDSRTFVLGFVVRKRRGRSRSEEVCDLTIRKELTRALPSMWYSLRRDPAVNQGKVSVGEILRMPLSALKRMERLFIGGLSCMGSRSLTNEPARSRAQRRPTEAAVRLTKRMLGYDEVRTEPRVA